MQTVQELMDQLTKSLMTVASTKTVIGEPVKLGDRILIPLISVKFGLGGGGGRFESDKEAGRKGSLDGGGVGGAIRVEPVAIACMSGESFMILSATGKESGSPWTSFVDKLPGIIEKVTDKAAEVARPELKQAKEQKPAPEPQGKK